MTLPGKARQKQTARGWFDRVFVQRKSYSGRFVQLYLGDAKQPVGSFGVSVSKRISPSAASRNYTKRVLRAWYGANRRLLQNHDIVIRIRCHWGREDFAKLNQELNKFLRRFG